MRKFSLSLLVLFFLFSSSCKKNTSVSDNVNPTPILNTITPNSSIAGDPSFNMIISGSDFVSTSIVKWNGVSLVTNYVNSNTLSVLISDSLILRSGTDSIKVFNPSPGGGMSTSLPFYCGTNNTNPSPTISNLSPASTTVGTTNFTLNVIGSNFIPTSSIRWNNVALASTYINSNQLTATISSSLLNSVGNVNVSVVNPSPGGGTSNNSIFTISANGNNPVPSITSSLPNNINAGSSSFTLIINGNNFTNSSVINWNGSPLNTTYISATQLSCTISSSLVLTTGNVNITVFNPAPGGGTTSALNFTVNAQGASPKKFLFDATKAETAGNADWVIDEDNNPQRTPTPSQSAITSSTSESYWTGALSSWGIALVKLGHSVETLPSGSQITFGNTSNPQDLSNYDVFVIDEPNTRFSTSEKQAILSFINNGGGLFMISDHTQSDRDNDGWDSPAIWNDFMTNNGVVNNPFGFSVDLTNISGTSSNVLTGNSTNVILHGSQGNVTQLDFSNGATLTLNNTVNTSVQGLIWESGYTQNNTHAISATSTYGNGRVYVVTDSSPMDDGTGGSGNTLYVGWSLYSHSILFLNASLWLAKVQ
jgi:hypothetical protein